MKQGFLFALLIFVFFQNTAWSAVGQDTLIPDRKYSGYRLQLTNWKVLKKEKGFVKASCSAINTGKFDIQLKNGSNLAFLQLTFDQSFLGADLDSYREAVRESLLGQNLKLKVGDFKNNIVLKFKETAPPPIIEKQPENVLVFNEVPNPTNGTSNKSTEQKKQESEIVFETPNFGTRTLEEILEEKNNCPDLVFDTLILVSNDGKTANLKFTISNIGKGPATIYQKGAKREEHLGIRAFISGSPVLSKGAVVIGGEFLSTGLDSSGGILLPTQSFTGYFSFDVRRKTRYMQTLVLSLDAYLKLHECDRTNNTAHVFLN